MTSSQQLVSKLWNYCNVLRDENPFQPSLLGVDFMLKTGAKLFFDPSKKEAYFEIDN